MGAVEVLPHARSIPFDNSTNGFTSNITQDAIEEAKLTAEGLPRGFMTCTSNGTLLATVWIARNELMASPRHLMAIKSRIKELSFINNNTNLGPFVIELYKNGQVSPTNLIYTWTPTATDRANGYGYIQIPTALDFNPGDSLFIRHVRSSGTSIADLVLDILIQQLP